MSIKDLKSLAGESFQVDPKTGAITTSEILRLRETYGIFDGTAIPGGAGCADRKSVV